VKRFVAFDTDGFIRREEFITAGGKKPVKP
jgi:hypothetical protein